jgi:carotenoid 1,2-hydratase
MKITSSIQDDISVVKNDTGSYEWWYFDARDHKGEYQVVVIFYEGCPFSSKYIRNQDRLPDQPAAKANKYPAISISVYKNGKTVYYSMSEYAASDASFNRDAVSVKVGESTMEALIDENDQLVYALRLSENLPAGDRISGMLRFTSPQPNPDLWKEVRSAQPSNSAHKWNLVQPLARVKGVLSINRHDNFDKPIIFEGVGYHDHNIGNEPMRTSFDDWYWGRIHFNDFTLVYYVMNKLDARDHGAWLISVDNQQIIDASTAIRIDGENVNAFGLSSARRLEFTFQDLKITILCNQIIDNGPFYMRFKSEARLKHFDKDEEVSFGISEYIKPKRIHYRLFWPLVHMRYRYAMEKPHWVQRTSALYRWTW